MDKTLKIELNYKDHYSYGMLHSGFGLFDYLYIENQSAEGIGPLTIQIAASSDFILSGKIAVDFVAPFGHKALSCDFVDIDSSFFAQLVTVENSGISVTVLDSDGNEIGRETFPCKVLDSDGNEIGRETFPCKLLPYHYFSGLGSIPESLALFVTPNQPELDSIANVASYSDSLDLCHQIYDKIKSRKITFSSDEFFGTVSLPIRLCERVLREGIASPLELGLLFASACERLGLAPLLAYTGKNKYFCGFYSVGNASYLLREFKRGGINLDQLYLIDCNYLAYGSELNFDSALLQSKNTLALSDEKITVLSIQCARELGILPLPNREGASLLLSGQDDDLKSAAFSEYFDLLREYSDEPIVTSILTDQRISAENRRQSTPYDYELDVNQNKILGKVLSNRFTLIRAQMGSGVSTIFSKAALNLLKAGKSILYITDPTYHSNRIVSKLGRYFDPNFVLDLTDEQQKNYSIDSFVGIFEDHEKIFFELEAIKKHLNEMDTYYSHLEGDKKIVSSFLMASDRYHQLRDANDSIIFSPEQVGMLSDDMVQKWFSSVNEIVKVVGEIGCVSDNPLLLIRQKFFTYEFKSKLIRQLEEVLHCIERITSIREQLMVFFPSLEDIRSFNTFYAFQDLVRLFSEFQIVPQSFFVNSEKVEDHFKKVTQLIQAKKENESILETIQISFQKDIFDMDASDLYTRYNQIKFDKSFKSIALKHSIFKNVKKYLKPNCDVENVEYILSRLDIYQKNSAFISEEKREVFSLLSIPSENTKENWDRLQVAADLCYQAYSVYHGAFFSNQLSDFAIDFCSASETAGVMEKLIQLRDLSEEYITLKDNFETTILNHLDFYYPEASARGNDYFSIIYGKLLSVLSAMDHLKAWCGWLSVREDALSIGLKNVINSLEAGKVRTDELRKSFLRAFFKSVCEYNFIAHPELIPENFDFDHKEFHDHSKAYFKLLKSEMNSVLSLRRLDAISALREKKLSPTELIDYDPNIFCNVYPLVISDLTTAEKLFKKHKKLFDLVFIENRGYIPVSNLLWTFSVGKNVSFAGALSTSKNAKDVSFDLNASSFDLLWKICEEKYSLSALYDGTPMLRGLKASVSRAICSDVRAYTAPAAKVFSDWEWVRLSGSYDSEYPGANLAEAEYCVDALLECICSDEKETLGVVTATQEQKSLVLRLLAQRLRQGEELNASAHSAERIHIFSADEDLCACDRIIFSLTYSSDRSIHGSRLSFKSLQFGGTDPKKRIQSIVSCAKKHLCVVSSFGLEELKFSPSLLSAASAFHLLLRLISAPLANNTYTLAGALDNTEVVSDLRSRLISKGYAVLSGIQNGRYYLDLAVFGTDGNFTLGIISDQTVMNQQSNLSSIEIANRDFYEKSGWRIDRIRSPQTFDSFDNELKRILELLDFSNSDFELI